MDTTTTRRYKITCEGCGQQGVYLEKESYQIPEAASPGDCADDMRIYFYEFVVEEGEFEIIHRDPNQYEHEVVCKKCRSRNIKSERII